MSWGLSWDIEAVSSDVDVESIVWDLFIAGVAVYLELEYGKSQFLIWVPQNRFFWLAVTLGEWLGTCCSDELGISR